MKLHLYITKYLKYKYHISPARTIIDSDNISIGYTKNKQILIFHIPIIDISLAKIIDNIKIECKFVSSKSYKNYDMSFSYMNYKSTGESFENILKFIIDRKVGKYINKFKYNSLL